MLRAKIAMAENKQLLDKIVQDIHGLYSVDPKSSEVRLILLGANTLGAALCSSLPCLFNRAVREQVATSFFAEHAKWSDPMFIVRGRDGIKVRRCCSGANAAELKCEVHE